MNRVLQFIRPRECRCCSELHAVERQLDAATIVAEQIEGVAGPEGLVEFWIPDASRVLKPKADDEDETGIRLLIGTDARLADIGEDLRQYAIDELTRIGEALLTAAARIESGVSR